MSGRCRKDLLSPIAVMTMGEQTLSRWQQKRTNAQDDGASAEKTCWCSHIFWQAAVFTFDTTDCRSIDKSCPLVKFVDDAELVGKISNDEDAIYHKQTENFVNWCDKNYLYLNVSEMKEMCIDFRKNQRCPKPVYIKGEAVERVDTYKYLGVVFDSKLNWKENINSVLTKENSRIYCMRKLRSFGVNSDMLVTFYNVVIHSIIMFDSVCWGGNISKLYRGRLEMIVKKVGHVVGKPLDM